MPLVPNANLLEFHYHQQSHFSILSHFSRLYFTRLRDSLTVASSTIQTWSSHLRSSLASATAAPALPDSATTILTDKIYSLLNTHSTASYTTLGATLLALVFLITRYLMTSYREGFFDGRGGRHSPYTSYLQAQTSNLSDFVEYGAGNEVFRTGAEPRYDNDHHRPAVARPPQHSVYEPDDAPDVLLLRYKGSHYELLFVPYAIAEGRLYVQDIRHFAAEKLRTDARRLRLLYKRRELTEDSWQARDYGLKQNSEITCVIIDANAVASDSSLSSDDDSGSNRGRHKSTHSRRQRPRGQSTARQRSDVQIPTMATMATPSSNLHPTSAGSGVPRQSRPLERSSGDSLNIPNGYERNGRAPSRSRQPSPAPNRQATYPAPPQPQPTAAPQPHRPSPPPSSTASSNIDLTSPLGKASALLTTFRTIWLPQCEHFISSPPSDRTTRDKTYKQLSESVLTQVVMKADDIDTCGDLECRKVRKQIVNEANEIMKALDVVGKR